MKNKGCVISAIVIAVVLILCGICGVLAIVYTGKYANSYSTYYEENEVVAIEGGEDKIAVIPVSGMILETSETSTLLGDSIASSENIINQIDRATADPAVKAIVLDINSPGGSVYASERILERIKKAQANGVVVVSLFREIATSGGYYIATSSDKIVADELTITGSIGVLMQFQDLSELYEKVGIEIRTITNTGGDFKTGEGLFDDDPDGEEDKLYQKVVDTTYNHFVDLVVEGRGLERSEVEAIADGRIFTGEDALSYGLIDELGLYEDALEVAEIEAAISNPTVIRYEVTDFWSLLMNGISKINPLYSMGEMIDPTPGPRLMYLAK